MNSKEWPAEKYAIGSYIQATVSNQYLPHINIKPQDSVLDIGCGNGAYSLKIIEQFPMSSFVGIDRSENMVNLARRTINIPHVSFELGDVMTLHDHERFDYIVSFWCLQWVPDLHQAFESIYRALKQEGNIFILLPTGDDELIKTLSQISASGQFPSLSTFKSPVNYTRLRQQLGELQDIPFKKLDIKRQHHTITLPSLDTFQKFLDGLPFFQGQIVEHEIPMINQAIVDCYAKKCQEQYGGECLFDFHTYAVSAHK